MTAVVPIVTASDWLFLASVLCFFAWHAKKWVALTLPLAVGLAALAVWVPTGSPRFTEPPPGKYTVLGADIQVDIAIYALLKTEGGPAVYYRLPYTAGAAGKLQEALDASEGRGARAVVGQDGGASYDGDPPVVSEQPVKTPERPEINLPGQ